MVWVLWVTSSSGDPVMMTSPSPIPQPHGSLGHHRWLHDPFLPFFSVPHCPLGLSKLQACPLPDAVFPPLFLSALSSPFHCALQDGLEVAWTCLPFIRSGWQDVIIQERTGSINVYFNISAFVFFTVCMPLSPTLNHYLPFFSFSSFAFGHSVYDRMVCTNKANLKGEEKDLNLVLILSQ